MEREAAKPGDVSSSDTTQWLGETVAFLALSTLQGVGYWTLFKLPEFGLSFKQVLKAPDQGQFTETLKLAGARAIKELPEGEWDQVQEKIWEAGKKLYRELWEEGISMLHAGQDQFPSSLTTIPEPPKWLFYQGDISLLQRSSTAVVGTRKSTPDGRFLSQYLLAGIAERLDTITVSGLADGIDKQVHEFSVRYGVPTIAILGTGIKQVFPAGSGRLRERIVKSGGLLLSEYLPFQSYSKANFIRRNRLQAGLARVVIPVEWKVKSGTAHTVRFAFNQKKTIICLTHTDWTEDEHTELKMAAQLGAQVFKVPGDEEQLFSSLKLALNGQHANTPQLSLFDA